MATTGLIVAVVAVILIISWLVYHEVDAEPPESAAHKFLDNYVAQEVRKARAGADNADQWAKDLVKKIEGYFQ